MKKKKRLGPMRRFFFPEISAAPIAPPQPFPSRGVLQISRKPAQCARELEENMSVQTVNRGKWLGSMALATMALGGLLLFSGATNAKADDGDGYRYQRQVQYTEWRGPRSPLKICRFKHPNTQFRARKK